MGINGLPPELHPAKRICHLRELSGKRAAIDVSIWIYSLSANFRGTNVEQTIFRKIQLLKAYNIDVVLVFDGADLEAKAETRERRRKYYEKIRTSERPKIRRSAIQDSLKTMCKNYGVEYVQSLYEADAQIAFMVREKEVNLVISEDSDFAVYGCDLVLYNLRGSEGQLFELSNFNQVWDVDYDADCFLAVCILSGSDYWVGGLMGFGIKSAKKLYKKLLPKFKYEKMVKLLKVTVDRERFSRAWYTFKHQLVFNFRTNLVVPLSEYAPGKTALDYPFAGDPEHKEAEHYRPDIPMEQRVILAREDLEEQRGYFCDVSGCLTVVSSAIELVIHRKQVHPFKCDHCGLVFRCNALLKAHKMRHTGKKTVICPICQKAFYSMYELGKHTYDVHSERPAHACEQCGISFRYRPTLDHHVLVTHTQLRPFVCPICSMTFTSKVVLDRHTASLHANVKDHVCPFCEKEHTHKGDLEKHIRSHLDEKPFVCSECGKEFKFQNNLKRHLEMHQNERKYKCSECNKGFNDQSTLRQHKMLHTGVKPHVCTECGRAFTHRSTLNAHMRTHTGERPYRCGECGKDFRFPHHLKNHELTHKDVWPHECHKCGRKFKQKGNMNSHLKICKSGETKNVSEQ